MHTVSAVMERGAGINLPPLLACLAPQQHGIFRTANAFYRWH